MIRNHVEITGCYLKTCFSKLKFHKRWDRSQGKISRGWKRGNKWVLDPEKVAEKFKGDRQKNQVDVRKKIEEVVQEKGKKWWNLYITNVINQCWILRTFVPVVVILLIMCTFGMKLLVFARFSKFEPSLISDRKWLKFAMLSLPHSNYTKFPVSINNWHDTHITNLLIYVIFGLSSLVQWGKNNSFILINILCW